MSLSRQVTLLLVGALLLAVLGSLGAQAWTTSDALRRQLQAQNDDAAALLALALSQQRGDRTQMEAIAAAVPGLGHTRRIVLQGTDGRTLVERRDDGTAARAPQWLVAAWPMDVAPGVARVTDGATVVGRLELSVQTAWAHEALWSALQRTAALLAALGAVAVVGAMLVLRAWQRRLDTTVAQAQALEEGRFVVVAEPRAPELRRLTRSMNAMAQRLNQVFDAQAAQVDALQRQAHTDAVTGLANRRRFLSLLDGTAAEQGPPTGALLLVRIQDLEGANRRLGHEVTDRLLAAVADVLRTYPERVAGASAGRLNGSDFALSLPVSGVAAETATSLMAALRASPAGTVGEFGIVIGGVDQPQPGVSGPLLAAADAALAQAEAAGPYAIEVQSAAAGATVQVGSRGWRRQIAQALAEGRAAIGAFPVHDSGRRLIYLECPLRVQLDPDGEFLAAGRWLALAARSRLMPQVDLAAVDLALQAVERDGVTRCVHVAAASLAGAGFVDDVRQRLLRHPGAAARLVLEVAEHAIDPLAPQLQQAVLAWRAAGAHVGIEHAGGALQGRPWLRSLGLEHVKLAAGFVRGVASDPAVRDYARSLVALVHGLGLRVIAEGIDDEADLAVLWELGFDGATGPAVRAEPAR